MILVILKSSCYIYLCKIEVKVIKSKLFKGSVIKGALCNNYSNLHVLVTFFIAHMWAICNALWKMRPSPSQARGWFVQVVERCLSLLLYQRTAAADASLEMEAADMNRPQSPFTGWLPYISQPGCYFIHWIYLHANANKTHWNTE